MRYQFVEGTITNILHLLSQQEVTQVLCNKQNYTFLIVNLLWASGFLAMSFVRPDTPLIHHSQKKIMHCSMLPPTIKTWDVCSKHNWFGLLFNRCLPQTSMGCRLQLCLGWGVCIFYCTYTNSLVSLFLLLNLAIAFTLFAFLLPCSSFQFSVFFLFPFSSSPSNLFFSLLSSTHFFYFSFIFKNR